MRKKFLLFLAIFSIVLLGLCSCSNDKDDEYKDAIIGTWELVQVKVDGRWYPMIRPTYAKFNQNGTYVGRGYFGNGYGTYDISGKTITCYVDGYEYVRYEIVELMSNTCTLKMMMGGDSMDIKCEKR